MIASRQAPPAPAEPRTQTSSVGRAVIALCLLFAVVTGVTYAVLSIAWPAGPITVHVRWSPDLTEDQRAILERRFELTQGERTEGTTWRYALTDPSSANIKALVQDPSTSDTAHLDRARYRPEWEQDRPLRMALFAAETGAAALLVAVVLSAVRRRITLVDDTIPTDARSDPPHTDLAAPATQTDDRRFTRASATVLVGAAVLSLSMHLFAGTPLLTATSALACLYVFGYVVGALLVARVDGDATALTVIRTIAGLLLSAIGFILSLVLSLPWWTGPVVLIAAAVTLRRADAVAAPRLSATPGWDDAVAIVLAFVLLSPNVISFVFMAPGPFPPAFYNVDTAYGLEKVHALVAADTYPPPSLGNLGVSRTYHYGSYAMAALVSRASGLLPHHALFLLVLPLLTLGVLTAAFAVARYVGTAVPRSVSVPLLLISVPALSRPFWTSFGPQLWSSLSNGFSLERMVGETSLWGVFSNEGVNIGGDFLVLASLAGLATTPVWGWVLPAFLIGSTLLVKTTSGVALAAGFGLAESWRMVRATRPWPSPLAVLAGAVFIVIAIACYTVSFAGSFQLEFAPWYHVRQSAVPGLLIDAAWLLLPALVVLTPGVVDRDRRSVPFLLMAVAPLILVNVSRLNNTQIGGGGTGNDWLQMLHTVPYFLHAFALSLASRRWTRIRPSRRAAFCLVAAAAIAPVCLTAGRYSLRLLADPTSGLEFVDNRPLGVALATIPTTGTIVVTNDLRYPAGNFTRNDRQLQIPALFGHQAFAVNYAYEAVEERRGLQQLLQQPLWSPALTRAAETYNWTHLLIRKDYAHPADIPLRQTFENEDYAVFRFR